MSPKPSTDKEPDRSRGAFGYTRCPDCGIKLRVTDFDKPDGVIGSHRSRECPKNPHPVAPKKKRSRPWRDS